MNFEEWYNTKGAGSHAGHTLQKQWGGKEAWDACRDEVLKIISNKIPPPISGSMKEFQLYSAISNIIKEIEKL